MPLSAAVLSGWAGWVKEGRWRIVPIRPAGAGYQGNTQEGNRLGANASTQNHTVLPQAHPLTTETYLDNPRDLREIEAPSCNILRNREAQFGMKSLNLSWVPGPPDNLTQAPRAQPPRTYNFRNPEVLPWGKCRLGGKFCRTCGGQWVTTRFTDRTPSPESPSKSLTRVPAGIPPAPGVFYILPEKPLYGKRVHGLCPQPIRTRKASPRALRLRLEGHPKASRVEGPAKLIRQPQGGWREASPLLAGPPGAGPRLRQTDRKQRSNGNSFLSFQLVTISRAKTLPAGVWSFWQRLENRHLPISATNVPSAVPLQARVTPRPSTQSHRPNNASQ